MAAAIRFFDLKARLAGKIAATHTVLVSNDCFQGRGFASAGATKGLSGRPLETFGAVLLMLYFECSTVSIDPI